MKDDNTLDLEAIKNETPTTADIDGIYGDSVGNEDKPLKKEMKGKKVKKKPERAHAARKTLGKKKDQLINIRLTKSERDQITALAEKSNMTITNLIIKALNIERSW
jgi:hypothetical protein